MLGSGSDSAWVVIQQLIFPERRDSVAATVGVLGKPSFAPEYPNTAVAAAVVADHAAAETEVEIGVTQQSRRVGARVLTRAPYDPERKRLTT